MYCISSRDTWIFSIMDKGQSWKMIAKYDFTCPPANMAKIKFISLASKVKEHRICM
jgi:hypothetical protein